MLLAALRSHKHREVRAVCGHGVAFQVVCEKIKVKETDGLKRNERSVLCNETSASDMAGDLFRLEPHKSDTVSKSQSTRYVFSYNMYV